MHLDLVKASGFKHKTPEDLPVHINTNNKNKKKKKRPGERTYWCGCGAEKTTKRTKSNDCQ